MKFAVAFAAFSAVAANAASLGKRQSSACYGAVKGMVAYERPFVYPLFEECNYALGTEQAKQNPWTNKICVAAAVVASMPVLHDGLECSADPDNSTSIVLPPISQWPSLDYNVYADIVGECAWAPDGCPITQQNFIDLVYGAISQETRNTPSYPDSAETLIKYYLTPVFNWTAFSTDAGIPYLNFNDWLHYSGDIDHCLPDLGQDC
ncbi:hypothetical protein BD309DRAFT_203843 [Dichomitus squalens]|uniref:Uncharacterized protein n=1 Tax=Dichomitus squalens TaxID=114155 RepID=A0A4V2K5M3_9APHY|nr:hypothetical protein BD309DRAFT_203843 [Dichomitus squalens]TBU58011.1 hypothetical protein BD310DRAFT_820318 [Dichomitus squalens]